MIESYAKILAGVKKFHEFDYKINKPLFEYYKDKQNPKVLFITCSDSRINPNLITQSNPGELFIIRNAGNIVPDVDAAKASGELATIEYALRVLKIENIIVCGHSDCGALRALINNSANELKLEYIEHWLKNIQTVKEHAQHDHKDCGGDSMHLYCTQENIKLQLENLLKLSFVKEKVDEGHLTLHGWYYDIGSGDILEFKPDKNEFISITDL